ncbi:MAG: TetR/AcrR family transcriptional regulator [Gemmatimonadetes bacterium]|nr:TetR/AcrR family transcriptional regulator [Gemmatimonadota bacterium]NNM03847.1 TetR/AcrR family transcriptional regulator [Gemmatimonadota bacterium]
MESSGRTGFITSPLKPPKQDRSRRTLDSIALAALELMEEGGVENATVAAIVERAGASVGSFYARFDGKDDLILYLQDRIWAEARDRWDQALRAQDWEKLSMEAVVEGVVGLLLRSFKADYHQREVLGRERRQDDEGARRVFAFHQHILATVTPLFLAHRARITHPDPEWAIRLGYRFAVGSIRELLELEGAVGVVDGAATAEALIPELARAWTAYLGAAQPEKREGGAREVDFFDPWG